MPTDSLLVYHCHFESYRKVLSFGPILQVGSRGACLGHILSNGYSGLPQPSFVTARDQIDALQMRNCSGVVSHVDKMRKESHLRLTSSTCKYRLAGVSRGCIVGHISIPRTYRYKCISTTCEYESCPTNVIILSCAQILLYPLYSMYPF